MNNKLLTLFLMGLLLTPMPLVAQDEDTDTDAEETEMTEEADDKAEDTSSSGKKWSPKSVAGQRAALALRRAETALKKFTKNSKKREKMKIKWESSDTAAFKTAAKYNLPVWVLYTDPSSCPACAALDSNIINSKKFKHSPAVFVGYRSASPLPKYDCTAKPMGGLYTPDKEKLFQLGYNQERNAEYYYEKIKAEADKIQENAEKKVKEDLEKAKADVEAAKVAEAETAAAKAAEAAEKEAGKKKKK